MSITIQKAYPQDNETIAQFQFEMALETESLKLDKDTLRNGVKAVFDHPHLGKYFIAKNNKETVASLLITYEWSDWRNAQIWWIQSVYVKPEHRRKGIFTAFYEFIKQEVAQDNSIGGIRLYVDKSNISAQKTYQKVGMNGEHYQLFEWLKK